MKLRVIAAGTRMPQWVNDGWQQYQQRMPAACALQLLEIPLTHRSRGISAERAVQQEGQRMLAAIPADHRAIVLAVDGQQRNTRQLADDLAGWLQDGRNVDFLVGGPDGLAAAVTERADRSYSLSALTLPHGLTRIVLAEQLYRAWTILQGHPYHRA